VSSNPFSTRFIRPGAIPFIFPDGQSAALLVDRLRDFQWRAQLIGPHGSGKSTLLAALIPALESVGREVLAIDLHQGQRRLPNLAAGTLSAATLLVIDGYEQLSWWSRRRVKGLCRRTGAGLLVTAHTDLGLPTLYSTEPSQTLAQAVVARLLAGGDRRITSDDISTAFAASGGNIRETLFRLYDIYHQRGGESG
jgi:hypothetical protein